MLKNEQFSICGTAWTIHLWKANDCNLLAYSYMYARVTFDGLVEERVSHIQQIPSNECAPAHGTLQQLNNSSVLRFALYSIGCSLEEISLENFAIEQILCAAKECSSESDILRYSCGQVLCFKYKLNMFVYLVAAIVQCIAARMFLKCC